MVKMRCEDNPSFHNKIAFACVCYTRLLNNPGTGRVVGFCTAAEQLECCALWISVEERKRLSWQQTGGEVKGELTLMLKTRISACSESTQHLLAMSPEILIWIHYKFVLHCVKTCLFP